MIKSGVFKNSDTASKKVSGGSKNLELSKNTIKQIKSSLLIPLFQFVFINKKGGATTVGSFVRMLCICNYPNSRCASDGEKLWRFSFLIDISCQCSREGLSAKVCSQRAIS